MECDSKEFKARISKISGQLAAIEKMFDEKRSAQDILQQLMAVRSSLGSLAKVVVEAEIKGCIPGGDPTPRDRQVGQLVDTLFKVA